MRFHCPKCDTKYRITEDKLAERPTAKMRCKECAVVFSVQEAIAAEGQRASEASTPGLADGARVSPSSNPPAMGVAAVHAPRPTRPPVPAIVAAGQAGDGAPHGMASRPLAPPLGERASPATGALGSPRLGPLLASRPLANRASDRPASGAVLAPRTSSVVAPEGSPGRPGEPNAPPGALPARSVPSTRPLGSPAGIALPPRAPLGSQGKPAALTPPGQLPTANAVPSPKPGGISGTSPVGQTAHAGARVAPPAVPAIASRTPGLSSAAARASLTKPTAGVEQRSASVRPPRGDTMSLGAVPAAAGPTPSSVSALSASAGDVELGPAQAVLGRGSASKFPPVTAERTLPAVPPFHAAPTGNVDAPSSGPAVQGAEPPARLVDDDRTKPVNEVPLPGETPKFPDAGADAADSFGPTPRLVGWSDSESRAISSGPWSSEVNAPSEPPDDAPEAVGTGASRDTRISNPEPATALAAGGVTFATPASSAADDLDFEIKTRSRPTRVVSLSVAALAALLFGASGFASGYLMGSTKAGPTAETSAAATRLSAESQARGGPSLPPPPPTSEQTARDESASVPAPADPAREVPTSKKVGERRSEQSAQAVEDVTGGSNPDSLSGLTSGAGPGPVAGSAAGQASAGTGLEAAAIQSTVQKNQNAVKRSCWQPALNGRAADAPSTARVTTTIQIAPSGAVTHVKHSGDPRGYPGLGACIVTRLKGWTFPKSNGSTTANIPFVFAAQ